MLSTGNTTVLNNQGFIQTYNDVNNGDFELNNGATVQAKGDFKIENDWINNSILIIDSGLVELYGANQWITGSEISFFWNMLLTGTDIKELAIDAHIKNNLDITTREFAVHDKNLFLDNSSASSIAYDQSVLGAEGIISTDEDGKIRKYIQINEQNIIPTGSSSGTFRHRPVLSNKLSGSIYDTLAVTFHNHTPNQIGLFDYQLEDSLCEIQKQYFYTLKPVESNSKFQLDFAHYPPIDGEYLDLATWESSFWKNVSNKLNYANGNYLFVRTPAFSDFTEQHFTLARSTPLPPYIKRDTLNCYQTANYLAETPLDQFNYNWDVLNSTQDGIITSGQGTTAIGVDWNSVFGGIVSLTYEDQYGCTSFPDSIIVLDVSVDANFIYGNYNSVNFDTEFQFTNTSSPNTTNIEWFIDDDYEYFTGYQMDAPYNVIFSNYDGSPFHQIMLVAHGELGDCYDTIMRTIEVPNVFVFYAPNTFTPDGDGVNDFFYCESSDLSKITLEIYNRWGEQLFYQEASNAEDIRWDGTYKGKIIQDGTYTYRFVVWPKNYNNAELSVKEFPGFINLLR